MNIAKLIDHTLLSASATTTDIVRVCSEANSKGFKAVCVNPSYVKLASGLVWHRTEVCSVLDFPLGCSTSEQRLSQLKLILKDGATEVDFVSRLGLIKANKWDKLLEDFKLLRNECPITLKAIIETCLLTEFELQKTSELCVESGIDFVKTSTGYSTYGATSRDIKLIKAVVGRSCGIKASHGIRSYDEAAMMISAGATRIGTSSGVNIMKEFRKLKLPNCNGCGGEGKIHNDSLDYNYGNIDNPSEMEEIEICDDCGGLGVRDEDHTIN